MSSKIIAGVEIGTSKVVVLIGEIVYGKTLNIVGMGTAPSDGVKKGEILNFNAARDATHTAIMRAEESAGVAVEAVYLAQTGCHLKTFFSDAEVTVRSSNNIVHFSDIRRLLDEAKRKQLPEDRAIIHHIQNGFYLDEVPVRSPQDKEGHKLEVRYWNIHGSINRMSDSIHIINGFGLKVEDLIVSSLASGKMVTSKEERENGALVIDIGSGTTDYVLYQNGHVVYTGVLAVGGDHITNDLSIGLRTSPELAEILKLKHGQATLHPKSQDDQVMLIGDLTIGDRSISRSGVCKVINARVDELFKIIRRNESLRSFFKSSNWGKVVLTGGTSKLKDIDKVAEKIFELPVLHGENPSWVASEIEGPEFCTGLGLLNFGLSYSHVQEINERKRGGALMENVKKLFNF